LYEPDSERQRDVEHQISELARHFRKVVATTPAHPLRARPAAETRPGRRLRRAASSPNATPLADHPFNR